MRHPTSPGPILLLAFVTVLSSCTSPVGDDAPREIAMTFSASRTELRTADSIVHADRVRAAIIDAGLRAEVKAAGGVTFNHQRLLVIDAAAGVYGFDSVRVTTIASRLPQVFRVPAGLDFRSLTDSVFFPTHPVVPVPVAGDTLSRSAGIELAWAPADDADATMAIMYGPRPQLPATGGETVEDDGSHTISPEMLAGFPAGPIYLFVGRFVHKEGLTAERLDYDIDAENVVVIECVLVE